MILPNLAVKFKNIEKYISDQSFKDEKGRPGKGERKVFM